MGRQSNNFQHVLTKESCDSINVLCLGKVGAYWKEYLSSSLTLYHFRQVMACVPVSEEHLDLVLASIPIAMGNVVKKLDLVYDWNLSLTYKDSMFFAIDGPNGPNKGR